MNKKLEELAQPYLYHEKWGPYHECNVTDYYEFGPSELEQFVDKIRVDEREQIKLADAIAELAELPRLRKINSELLGALKKLLAQYDSAIEDDYSGTSMFKEHLGFADHARAAIAKAEGSL